MATTIYYLILLTSPLDEVSVRATGGLDRERTPPVEEPPSLMHGSTLSLQTLKCDPYLPQRSNRTCTLLLRDRYQPVNHVLLQIHVSHLLSALRMTTIGPPVESEADATADIGTIWQTAINRYEESARVKIESLAGASSVDVILDDIREQETKFKGYRHDGSRLAKFRTLVARSLGPIEKVGDIVASAASLVRR